MAHHQHHGLHHAAHSIQSPDIQQVSTSTSHTVDDDLVAEVDEPPDSHNAPFRKTSITVDPRKSSMLTRALHSDTESHGDDEDTDHGAPVPGNFLRQTSRSSTCSTFSGRSGFTSDEGLTSSGTRSSTPNSPPRPPQFSKPDYVHFKSIENPQDVKVEQASLSQSPKHVSASGTSEPAVEAELGRKRCITFSCGQQNPKPCAQSQNQEPENKTQATEPAKRTCMIKFACPSKLFSKNLNSDNKPCASRHLSPPPPPRAKSPSPSHTPDRRAHRDSDTTIKYESPKTTRKIEPLGRVDSSNTDDSRSEAVRFHEFASSDEEVEEWTQESTCHKSKLTIEDTLVKEKAIQQLGEEAEEEALEEEDAEEDVIDDEDEDDLLDEISEGGFQTDDEEGFAESDDDDDGDSDYEWWAPKRSSPPETATMLPSDTRRPQVHRAGSDSSINSAISRVAIRSSKSPAPMAQKRSRAIPIRPGTPELPDSTDFVCGTLDEDRPLEEAYASCIEQRKAAKHRSTPQDIDPTFPTSDPDLDTDEEDDEDLIQNTTKDTDDDDTDEGPRGRKATPKPHHSPRTSPKRLRSPAPAPMIKAAPRRNSPAPPRALFSPSARHVGHTQTAPLRLKSPRPSRHTSPNNDHSAPIPAQRFLAQRPQLTHTTSLPRSPNPFSRGFDLPKCGNDIDTVSRNSDEENDDTATSRRNSTAYARGAIDIVQGLERKRLRRRQHFMEKYHRKEEKKRERGGVKRPQPGKGAERMRQVGIECAVYRGKRVLSI